MNEFFALMSRMKYIERWGLMHRYESENVLEHSALTAMLAHSFALMENRLSDSGLDAEHIAVLALYHEAAEVITGDLPTPVKYYNPQITSAYKAIESEAEQTICSTLPDLIADDMEGFVKQRHDGKEKEIVKAADKSAALVKCAKEVKSGNSEFAAAYETTLKELQSSGLKSVKYFLEELLPTFDTSLDEYFSPSKK